MQYFDGNTFFVDADQLVYPAKLLFVVQIQLILVQNLFLLWIAHGGYPQRNIELLVKGFCFVFFLQIEGDLSKDKQY